jgi:chromosome segregation ATPase
MMKDNEAMQNDLIALDKDLVETKTQLNLSRLEVERLNQASLVHQLNTELTAENQQVISGLRNQITELERQKALDTVNIQELEKSLKSMRLTIESAQKEIERTEEAYKIQLTHAKE